MPQKNRSIAGLLAVASVLTPALSFAQEKRPPESAKQAIKPVAAIEAVKRNPHKPEEKLPFPVSDVRGDGEPTGVALASSVTKKGFVALVIHGDNPALIENAQNTLLAVYHSGRKRVGLIIADGDVKTWEVYADGHSRTIDRKANAFDFTSSSAVRSIVEQYDTFVVPLLPPVKAGKPEPK